MNIRNSTDDRLEILSVRIFPASREELFQCFKNPRDLAEWWGPKGFRNTFHEFDLRPGGRWRFTMHGPDGVDYETEKEFLEVESPERIVLRHSQSMHDFQMSLVFEPLSPNSTRLTWRMVFDPAGENRKLKEFITAANEENFDRLEAHLRKKLAATRTEPGSN